MPNPNRMVAATLPAPLPLLPPAVDLTVSPEALAKFAADRGGAKPRVARDNGDGSYEAEGDVAGFFFM